MLFNNLHTKRKPKEEHIDKTLGALRDHGFYSPIKLGKKAGISLTATKCVLQYLDGQAKLDVRRQQVSPRLEVRLRN